MKKVLFLLGAMACSVGVSFAQSAHFGVSGGLNLSNFTESSGGSSTTYSNHTGYHIGVFADLDLGSISIQPGVYYSQKGAKNSQSSSFISGTTTYNYSSTGTATINYVEVPVNLLYHIPIEVGHIFLGGGPYVALGLSGNTNSSFTQSGGGLNASGSSTGKVTFGSGSSDIKNPDYGVNILAGLQLKGGLLFSVGYGLGLANLNNNSGTTDKNSVLRVSVGFSIL